MLVVRGRQILESPRRLEALRYYHDELATEVVDVQIRGDTGDTIEPALPFPASRSPAL